MRRPAWLTIGWGLAAVAVFGLYLRWSAATETFRIGLVGLLPLLLLVPLAGLIVSSWRGRSPSLRLAAFGTTLVYLATFFSVSSVIGCGARSAEDDIVVYSHNVRWQTGDPLAIGRAIGETDPDVIVLQEVSSVFRDALSQVGVFDAYPYRASEILGEPTGVAVWSRWPMSETSLSYVARRPLLEAVIEGPTGPFRVRGVHLASPISEMNVRDWIEGLGDLEAYPISGPTIMAGDFNSTADHTQFRRVLAQGWTDVHERKGCGFDATWPADRKVPFSVLRLDHVLVSEQFEVLSVEIGEANGSDHRPVITSLRLTVDPQ